MSEIYVPTNGTAEYVDGVGIIIKGEDGYSPTIEVEENTSSSYKLRITDVEGSYVTPNLKGSGGGGGSGVDGTTFYPSVSSAGVISWTNDGGKENPTPVNIKGPQGPTGATGATGQNGQDGDDGFSPIITVTDNTTYYTVTLQDATHTETIQIQKSGGQGPAGQDGYSPIATVTKSGSTATISITDKNGTTTATVSDGTNGTNGTDGQDGQDGYTPVRGTDYWTAADQQYIINAVLTALPAAESVSV